MQLNFPDQLNHIQDNAYSQEAQLKEVALLFAECLTSGGVVHIYANGHSRVMVEELCVRMGALTGFHALLNNGLSNFTDVVGRDGLRMCQAIDAMGKTHPVLGNMHIEGYGANYDEWLDDQRKRYAKVTYDPDALRPLKD